MSENNLQYIFKPQSVAIIGASAREGSLGRIILSNVLMNSYSGVVYPVHMKAKSVLGVKAYSSVLHIPDSVDLAVLVVPAVAVPEVLAECGQKGVKGIVVITAGFKEIGPAGAQLEKRVGEKIYWWRIFEQITYTCPDEIELTNIKLERDRKTNAPDKLIIKGFYKEGISLEQVFIRNLDANEKIRSYFDHFIVADREPKEGKTTFAIFCHFKEGLL